MRGFFLLRICPRLLECSILHVGDVRIENGDVKGKVWRKQGKCYPAPLFWFRQAELSSEQEIGLSFPAM
jgi:hypothetical protein